MNIKFKEKSDKFCILFYRTNTYIYIYSHYKKKLQDDVIKIKNLQKSKKSLFKFFISIIGYLVVTAKH